MLAYGRKSGKGSYGPGFMKKNISLGGRVIELKQKEQNLIFWSTRIIEIDPFKSNQVFDVNY